MVEDADMETREKFIEEQFEKTRAEVREYLNLAAQKRIEIAERTRVDSPFKFNDIVWLYNRQIKKGHVKKLAMPWHGPFRIIKFVTPVTVMLRNQANRTVRQPVHISRLKLYKSPQRPEEELELESNIDALKDNDLQLDESDEDVLEETTTPITLNPVAEKILKENLNYQQRDPCEDEPEVSTMEEDDDTLIPNGEYEVERILNHRNKKGSEQYFDTLEGIYPHSRLLDQRRKYAELQTLTRRVQTT